MTRRFASSRLRGRVAAVALVGLALAPIGVPGQDVAPAEWYAPLDFEIVNVEASVAIASNAGERVPIVVVHDAAIGEAVTLAFEDAFTRTHEDFLAQLQQVLGFRVLDAAAVAGAEFREFRARFQATSNGFPVSPALAQTWARGYDGEPVRERIGGLLRALERDTLIGEIRPASSVFVLPAGTVGAVRAWGEVAPRPRAVDPSAVLSVPAAGELLRRMNDPLDRTADGFLAGLIRANIAEDRYLTGLLLRERLGAAAVVERVALGTRLTDAGQPLDGRAAAALEWLARQGIQPLNTAPEPVPVAIESVAPAVPEPSAEPEDAPRFAWVWWLAGGVLALGMAGLVAFGMIVRRRTGGYIQVTPTGSAGGTASEALIPHLAREWKDRLVRALFTQRSVLLENEQAASRRVQEMEERLARLQPAIAERIRSYEQRIETLEREIAERDAETRDLLRAKLVLARRELDAEIARNRITWN